MYRFEQSPDWAVQSMDECFAQHPGIATIVTAETQSACLMDKEYCEAFRGLFRNRFVDKKKVGSKVLTQAKGA